MYNSTNFDYYPNGLSVTVAPASEPVTAAQAKLQAKVDYSTEDSLIAIYIQAARELVEKKMGIALLPQTIQEKHSAWPLATRLNPYRAIRLHRYPLRAVSSVGYLDENGDAQVLDSSTYVVSGTSYPPMIAPANGQEWPDVLEQVGAITITYTAGYDDADSVPADIRQAILLIVADWFDNRENAVHERMTAADAILLNRRGFHF